MRKKYHDDLQGNLLEYCKPQQIETTLAAQETENDPEQKPVKTRLSPQEKIRIGIIPKNYQVRAKDVFDEETREKLRNSGFDDCDLVRLWYS